MKKEEILKEFRQKFASAYLIADEAVIDTFLRAVESWWLLKLSENTTELKKKVEGKNKIGNNAEGLPFENSPEIYGNQRVEAYKKGYNQALSDVLSELNHQ